MISREEFIEDVKIGDIIKISTKTENVVGKVERIGDTSVKITRLDSEKPKTISYSDIIGCDFEITSSTVETDNQRFEESIDLNEFYDSEKQEYGNLKPAYGLLTYVNFDQNLAYISNTFRKGGEYKHEETIRFSPSLFKFDMVNTRKFFYLVRYISHKYGDKIEIDESYPIEFLQKIERKCLVRAELNIDEDELNIEKTDKDKIVVDFQAKASPRLVVNVPVLVNGESFFYLKDSGIYSVANCDYVEDEILYTTDGVAINLDQQNIYRFATISDFDDKFQYGSLNGKNDVPLSLIDDKAYNILKTAGQSMFLCYSCSNNKLSRIERIPLELNSQLVWQKGKVTDSNITPRERSFTIDESVKHLLSVLSDGLINKKSREVGFKGTEIYYKKVSCPNWHDNKLNDFAIEVRCTSEPARIEYDSVRNKYLAYRNNTFFYEINGEPEELEKLLGQTTTVYFQIAPDSYSLQASINSSIGFFRIPIPFVGISIPIFSTSDLNKKEIQNKIKKAVHELKDDKFAFDIYTNNCLLALRDKSQTENERYANLYSLFLSDFCNINEFQEKFSDGRGNKNKVAELFNKTPQKPEQLLRHIILLEETNYKLLSQIVDFNSCQGLESIVPIAKKMDTTAIFGNDIEKCFEILRGIYMNDKVKFFDRFSDIKENIMGETLSAIEDTEIRFVNFCCESDKSIFADIREILKKQENCNEYSYLEKERLYKKSWEYINALLGRKSKITIEFKDLLLSTNILSKLKQEFSQLLDDLYKNSKFWPQIDCLDQGIFYQNEDKITVTIKNNKNCQNAGNVVVEIFSPDLDADSYEGSKNLGNLNSDQEIDFDIRLELKNYQKDKLQFVFTITYEYCNGFFENKKNGTAKKEVAIVLKRMTIEDYNGQGFLDKKILKKSVFYRSMSCHAVSPVFPNSEFSL